MDYKLLAIGYHTDIEYLQEIIKDHFNGISIISFPVSAESIHKKKELTVSLRNACATASGAIYLRKELYEIISTDTELPIPVRYVEMDEVALQQALLRARLHSHSAIRGISVDIIPAAELRFLLQDEDIFTKNAIIWDIPFSECFSKPHKALVEKHIRNINSGADLVLTNFPDIAEELRRNNIAVYYAVPGKNNIIQEIRNLKLGIKLYETQNRLAYVYLCLRYKYTTIELIQLPVREMNELSNISNNINAFAQSIDAACFSLSRWEFVILCDENLLMQKTASLTNLPLLKKICNESIFDALMSIGIGRTAKTAYSSAMISYSSSVRIRNTNAVITYEGHEPLPPLIYKMESGKEIPVNTDDYIFSMAEKSSVSYESLHKLYIASLKKESKLFNSREIAEILGISSRSANRLLVRLLDSDCATIVNSVSLNTKGRPNRVIQIHF